MRQSRVVVFVGVLFLFITTAYAGGWAMLTMNEVSSYAIAGKAFSMTFTVRQHAATPVKGLKPVIRATAPGQPDIRTSAAATGRDGEYRFDLTLPRPGDWKIEVDSGFFTYLMGASAPAESPKLAEAGYVVLPMKVIAEGSVPTPVSEKQRGEWLFNAKGCLACHGDTNIGPDLTKVRLQSDFVKRVLADPAVALKRTKDSFGDMPNLNLKTDEIDALTAFLVANSKT